jgi:His-Xaa-Ser system radical SAM maturase HxsC
MLLKLSAPGLRALSEGAESPFVGRICEDPERPEAERHREILLVRKPQGTLPVGFRAYLVQQEQPALGLRDLYLLGARHNYLAHDDVVRINPGQQTLSALYRRSSKSNTFLVTEQCDNYCVMCSQPPRARDDSWLVDEIKEVIPLISPETEEIGISGGEPALLGARLVELIGMLKQFLPRTAVHVLSNGRRFRDQAFARAIGEIAHADLMIGIPVYSDIPEEHDYVVQAKGAFDETIRGILNLKRAGVRVELRFVIHRDTFARLPQFAQFVARNLLFVDHVALMGLEPIGFAKSNIERLWIDPLDYQSQLAEAVTTLSCAGAVVSIYNHQLCVLHPELHRYARKSISDWKNLYFDECESCQVKNECGGFFASAQLRKSRGIEPVRHA